MTPFILSTIIFLAFFSLAWMIAYFIRVAIYKDDIQELRWALKSKEETISALRYKASNKGNKQHVFSTEKSLELSELFDQTKDETKSKKAWATLWKKIEEDVPEIVFPSAKINTQIPTRYCVSWDENDKDPLKEQK